MSIKVNEGESVTLAVAGAELTLAADAIARMWIDRLMAREAEPVVVTAEAAEVPVAHGCIGSHFYEGKAIYAGIMRGGKNQRDYHLFLLAANPPEKLSWDDAMRWAESIGNGASLPSRKEQALLFANLADQLEEDWYWSNEQYAGDDEYAWCQYFYFGGQLSYYEGSKLRVVAVRRLPIQ